MSLRFRRRPLFAALICAAALASGCTRIADHQGFLLDTELSQGIQPGIDNRDSVLRTLGRPSFVGQFDQNDWYYVARDTQQLAFNHPTPIDQTVMRVRFDAAGNVVAVDRSGVEMVADITPSSDETPTLGRTRSFFDEIFGNIGATGGPRTPGSGTADNPQ
jgi:outer membrane protein assembly factor BamE (lipoprotein component of BamABCDE complex)